MKRTSLTALAVVILLSLPHGLWAQALVYPPGATNFATIGIALGQSLKLNLGAFPPSPANPSSVAFPANPCVATLGFQDGNGNLLGATNSVTLQAGQTASLTLSFAAAITAEAAINANTPPSTSDNAAATATANVMRRIELLPVVTTTGDAGQCVATLEVVDNVLRATTQGITGTVAYPNAVFFGPVSVYPFLNVELNVSGAFTHACIAQLSFTDKNGNPIGPTKTVDTSASASLTLPWQTIYPTYPTIPSQPQLITPVVSTSTTSACVASCEVIDVLYGRSWAIYPVEPITFPLAPIYLMP